MANLPKVNLDIPRWDQNTYMGRVKYFLSTTNPLNLLATPKQLEKAKDIVTKYRCGGMLQQDITMEDVYRAKDLYDSAFHPESGKKMFLIGRMSAQVPINMFITGGLLMFYDSYIGVIFWQWVNQSFNAIVNYTNRSGDTKLPLQQLLISYILATGGALATALSFNQIVVNAPHLVRQCVPFVGVAAANCINIPLMRFQELKNGIPVVDDLNRQIGISKKAAFIAICSVVCSRMIMVLPGLTFSPIVVHFLEDSGYIKKEQKIQYAILQTFLCGFFLALATPMACAVFSQRSKISIDKLEQDLQEKIQDLVPKPELVFYNKGL